MVPFWKSVEGDEVLQGDWLPNCTVPVFRTKNGSAELDEEVTLDSANLIVVTQSCDLEQDKTQFVALCRILAISEFDAEQDRPLGRRRWEEVRKGRHEGLHLLASPTHLEDSQRSLVVDFRLIVSLPVGYVRSHAGLLGKRWRLDSPFLEHFSQAFARFFMRVGLPSAIPSFR